MEETKQSAQLRCMISSFGYCQTTQMIRYAGAQTFLRFRLPHRTEYIYPYDVAGSK